MMRQVIVLCVKVIVMKVRTDSSGWIGMFEVVIGWYRGVAHRAIKVRISCGKWVGESRLLVVVEHCRNGWVRRDHR